MALHRSLFPMTQACTVIVELSALPGHETFVIELLLDVIPEIQRGPGCQLYALHEKTDGTLVLLERFESRQHWQDHFEWPAIRRLKDELAHAVELPVVRREMYRVESAH